MTRQSQMSALRHPHLKSGSGGPAIATRIIAPEAAALHFLLIAALIFSVVTAWLVPQELLFASVGVVGLGAAGFAAIVAWQQKTGQDTSRLNAWDICGLFAFIGFGACMLSEPDTIAQLFANDHTKSTVTPR